MAETKTYSGGCHCGKVRYEADDLDLARAISCDCTICRMRGSILTFIPAERFRLLAGEGELQDYRFNTHTIAHLFCKTCGVASFAQGQNPDGVAMRAINLRCVDDVDIDALQVHRFDGASA